jgi:hypothetical protein
MVSMDWGTFLHTTPFEWWSSIGGVHLVFHNLIAIHRAKPNANSFSAFAWLREISYHDHTLVASMVFAEFIFKYWPYTRSVELLHCLARDTFVYTTKLSYNSHHFLGFRSDVFCMLLEFELGYPF